MSDVADMIAGLMRREGGYVNHPADRGGPTHFGITQATLSTYLGREASLSEVENLKAPLASLIYLKNYYYGPGIDQLPSSIQSFVFDSGVNHGPQQALIFVQRSCNLLGAKPPLKEDGIMGDNTRRAASTAARRFSARFIKILIAERRHFYFKIVEAEPTQQVFLRGWLNRLAEFDDAETRFA